MSDRNLVDVVEQMAHPVTGVVYKNRSYRLKSYPMVFVAKEAIDWMIKSLRPPVRSRQEGSVLGTQLIASNLIHHVKREHVTMSDDFLFFRFQKEVPCVDGLLDIDHDPPILYIHNVVMSLRSHRYGITIKDRSYGVRTFKSCFVGSELVDWLSNHLMLLRSAAVSIGQFFIDHGLLQHVAKERDFCDHKYYYRWLQAADDLTTVPDTMPLSPDAVNASQARMAAGKLLGLSSHGSVSSVDKDRVTSSENHASSDTRSHSEDAPVESNSTRASLSPAHANVEYTTIGTRGSSSVLASDEYADYDLVDQTRSSTSLRDAPTEYSHMPLPVDDDMSIVGSEAEDPSLAYGVIPNVRQPYDTVGLPETMQEYKPLSARSQNPLTADQQHEEGKSTTTERRDDEGLQ